MSLAVFLCPPFWGGQLEEGAVEWEWEWGWFLGLMGEFLANKLNDSHCSRALSHEYACILAMRQV